MNLTCFHFLLQSAHMDGKTWHAYLSQLQKKMKKEIRMLIDKIEERIQQHTKCLLDISLNIRTYHAIKMHWLLCNDHRLIQVCLVDCQDLLR